MSTKDNSLPDENRVGQALRFLSETDERWARACAALEAAEMAQKQAREIAFLEASGTQAVRAAAANSSERVKIEAAKVEAALYEKELLKARRSTAIVVIDVWRSLNSNKRAGMV